MKFRQPKGTWVCVYRATMQGLIFAPPMFSEESDRPKAIKDVKKRSRLADFPSWRFE